MINIYVGNLSFKTTDNELRELFAAFGEVAYAAVIRERDSSRSKGFGFVEMPDEQAAKAAIEAMNGKEVGGRNLRVNEARPREERPARRANDNNRW